jgi:Protein of unknown function (DUF1638)
MNTTIKIYVCDNFKEEILEVIKLSDFKDIESIIFPVRCGCPNSEEIRLSIISELSQEISKIRIFLGCSCLSKTDKSFLSTNNIRYLNLENCFQMFFPKEIINSLMSEGAYLVTPGWLVNWRKKVNQWGGEELAKEMFSESLKKIVLLDTGTGSCLKILLKR